MADFEARMAELEPGALHFRDSDIEQAWRTQRANRLEVWSIPLLARVSGVPLEGSGIYDEVVKPAGLIHSAVATSPLPTGEAFLGVAHSRPDGDLVGEEAGLSVMRMVLPAFKAGVQTLVRLYAARASLARMLDALAEAVAVFDLKGRELHRSWRLDELLTADPERERVVVEMHSVARSLAQGREAHAGLAAPRAAATGTLELQTATARYTIRGTYAGSGILGMIDAVIVQLDRLTPTLPMPEQLVERHGLTKREAEIALLLARGLSNREIADRLSISPHTVRHHAEAVFAKLGVHSRRALMLLLLRDEAGGGY
jgi:DNA-binding CsgD family transcriptional regulator